MYFQELKKKFRNYLFKIRSKLSKSQKKINLRCKKNSYDIEIDLIQDFTLLSEQEVLNYKKSKKFSLLFYVSLKEN